MEAAMIRIMLILLAVIGTTLMGVGVTAVLAANLPGWKPIALAALAGGVLSLPIAWAIARRITAASA